MRCCFVNMLSALTENAQPIVDGDDDYVAVAGQHGAIVRIAGAPLERFAVHEEEDGVRCLQATVTCRKNPRSHYRLFM